MSQCLEIADLDLLLRDQSYVGGHQPSRKDVVEWERLEGAPDSQYPHALRWYHHIASFGTAKSQFPEPPVSKSKSGDGLEGKKEKTDAKKPKTTANANLAEVRERSRAHGQMIIVFYSVLFFILICFIF